MTASLVTQPGFVRARAAVRAAEIGLLRAVAIDIVASGEADALRGLGPAAIEIFREATGPTSVDLQAHATDDGRAVTFLGRADHAVAVSAHLSALAGEHREYLRAAVRLVGTHGSVLVDLLGPMLDVRTVAGAARVPFGVTGPNANPHDATETLSAIAESARSGRNMSTTW